jgi:hypothetical protein
MRDIWLPSIELVGYESFSEGIMILLHTLVFLRTEEVVGLLDTRFSSKFDLSYAVVPSTSAAIDKQLCKYLCNLAKHYYIIF